MLYIAHRGNTRGPNPAQENSPAYILAAINAGFMVEVDVWAHDSGLFLGHDSGRYEVSLRFLMDARMICHAKNYQAALVMNEVDTIHWFWHETDKLVLTSKQWLWTHPKVYIPGSIMNQPEFDDRNSVNEAITTYLNAKSTGFRGVCSDYVEALREYK